MRIIVFKGPVSPYHQGYLDAHAAAVSKPGDGTQRYPAARFELSSQDHTSFMAGVCDYLKDITTPVRKSRASPAWKLI